MDANIGKELWPGWETTRLIGQGSYGAVYEIQRDVFGETEKAALKAMSIPQSHSEIDELYNDGYDDQSVANRFQTHLKCIVSEYTLMRKMNGSANVVNCDDVRYTQHADNIGWDVFIKMELLTPLAKALPEEIPEETALKLAHDLCSALDLCKKHDIVHRDIKPQNIFVSDNGDFKLGDFGVAKTMEKTMGGTKIGTYKYMAPEVYNNQPYGSASDIYSLGLVLYWLLNDRRMPFLPLPPERVTFKQEEQSLNRRLSGEQLPPPAHGSEVLKQIVLKACAYNPAERYSNAEEMLRDLNAGTIAQKPVSAQEQEPAIDSTVRVARPAMDRQATPAVQAVPTAPVSGKKSVSSEDRTMTVPAVNTPQSEAEDRTISCRSPIKQNRDIPAETTNYKKKPKVRLPILTAIFAVIAIAAGLLFFLKDGGFSTQKSGDNTLFRNGMMPVSAGSKFGYINQSGEFVIGPRFDSALWFSGNGLAAVEVDEKFGFIDKTGKFVIQPQFDGAWPFTNNGLARVRDDEKFGYIDKTGKFVIEPLFDRAQDFTNNGLALVMCDEKFGYIDKTGKFVIEPQFEWAQDFTNSGLALVMCDEKFGYIDRSGSFIFEPQLNSAGPFGNKALASATIEGKFGYINRSGEFVIEPKFDGASPFCANGLARVEVGGKYGYINTSGEFVIEPQFDNASLFSSNGLAPVVANGKHGFINESGEFVINPQFDNTTGFYDDGYAIVQYNGKIGIINEDGRYVINPQFGINTLFYRPPYNFY